MKGGSVSTSDFSVDTLGGQVKADVAIRPFDAELPFQVGLLIDRLVLQEIADLAGSEEKMPGTASMNYGGHGSLSFADYNGAGTLDVADAEFYALPLFGKVFGVVNGLNFGIIRKGEKGFARGPFTIKEGVITTDDIEMLVSSMKIEAPGTVDLVEEVLDLKMKVVPTGVVGLATAVTAGPVDVDVSGPMADPEVKLGLSGGIAGTTMDLAGNTLGAAGDVAGAAMGIIPGMGQKDKPDPGVPPASEADTKAKKKSEKKGFFSRWKKE